MHFSEWNPIHVSLRLLMIRSNLGFLSSLFFSFFFVSFCFFLFLFVSFCFFLFLLNCLGSLAYKRHEVQQSELREPKDNVGHLNNMGQFSIF